MSPVYAPPPHYGPYATVLALFGRRNGSKVKPQGVRKGKRRTKPEHRGGAAPKGGKK